MFWAWRSTYLIKIAEEATNEVVRLRNEMTRKQDSIYTMSKSALVMKAVAELGWTRDQAEAETVAQLRLHLKENRGNEEPHEEEERLPLRLTRMLKTDLQEESTRRGLPISDEQTGMLLIRQVMIRNIRVHAGIGPPPVLFKKEPENPDYKTSTSASRSSYPTTPRAGSPEPLARSAALRKSPRASPAPPLAQQQSASLGGYMLAPESKEARRQRYREKRFTVEELREHQLLQEIRIHSSNEDFQKDGLVIVSDSDGMELL